jgi:hypothetical protein
MFGYRRDVSEGSIGDVRQSAWNVSYGSHSGRIVAGKHKHYPPEIIVGNGPQHEPV